MRDPRQIYDILADLVREGCTITIMSLEGAKYLLADAAIWAEGLWYFFAFGENQTAEHFLNSDYIEYDGEDLTFYLQKKVVAKVAPLEDDEERKGWAEWKAMLNTPRGAAIALAVSEIKARHQSEDWAPERLRSRKLPSGSVGIESIEAIRIEYIDGRPILRFRMNGRESYVLEPKRTLLAAGIVVLLDDADFWQKTLSARYDVDGESILIPGGSTDPQLVDVVRYFVALSDSGGMPPESDLSGR